MVMTAPNSLTELLLAHPEKGHDLWLQQYEMRKLYVLLLTQEIKDSGARLKKIVGNGGEEWIVNDPRDSACVLFHRLDGPASIDENGKDWMVAGELHRFGGPAVEYYDNRGWYLYGVPVESYDEYKLLTGCSNEDILLLKLMWGNINGH